jgi:hypothetical protein
MSNPALPQLTDSVGGSKAKNNKEDVKQLERLINLAILNEWLPGYMAVSEDGNLSAQELKALHALLLKRNGISKKVTPAQIVIKPGSGELKTLVVDNPLADSRWDEHDTLIQGAVGEFNKKLEKTPGFDPLDWKLVKAMLWTEVMGGPGIPEWKTNPLQFGVPGDAGKEAVVKKDDHGLVVSEKLRKEIADAGSINTASLSIRGAVAYLFLLAGQYKYMNVVDGAEVLEYTVTKEDRGGFSDIAPKVGSTVKTLQAENPDVKVLRPGQKIKYKKAHGEWQITGWDKWMHAVNEYNGLGSGAGDEKYMDKVKARYGRIQGKEKWIQTSAKK